MQPTLCLLFRLLAGAALFGSQALAQQPAARWFKGNTHAHTLNSDGDSPPETVARWYRDHGYNFTFITDHEFLTDVAPLNAALAAPGKFEVFTAQELTQRVADAFHPDGVRQAHVNGFGVTRVVRPLGEKGIAQEPIASTYARNLAALAQAGGLPQVNHPNFRWSVGLDDMALLPDSTLFEVWNGHPQVYNLGGTDAAGRVALSTEALWDSLLTRGKVMFGVGDDDSHYFKPADGDNQDQPRPGRAWVMVRADTLTQPAIIAALRRGDFYASTGVTLKRYAATAREIDIEIQPVGDMRYRIEFIGDGGRVLSSTTALRATHSIAATERYVRVRITDSSGHSPGSTGCRNR